MLRGSKVVGSSPETFSEFLDNVLACLAEKLGIPLETLIAFYPHYSVKQDVSDD